MRASDRERHRERERERDRERERTIEKAEIGGPCGGDRREGDAERSALGLPLVSQTVSSPCWHRTGAC